MDRDRVAKLHIYPEAGIAQYIIINLVDNIVELYERPLTAKGQYADARRLVGSDSVQFSCGQGRSVSADVVRLLPAR